MVLSSGRSCITQLLSHFEDVLLDMVDGSDVNAIYSDYTIAFDKVDHRILLKNGKIRIL